MTTQTMMQKLNAQMNPEFYASNLHLHLSASVFQKKPQRHCHFLSYSGAK